MKRGRKSLSKELRAGIRKLAKSFTPNQIGTRLGIAPATVRKYLPEHLRLTEPKGKAYKVLGRTMIHGGAKHMTLDEWDE